MKKKAKIIGIVFAVLLVIGAAQGLSGGTSNSDSQSNTDNGTKIVLTAGEAGEYGVPFTMNEGTEFEETYYIYHIPTGTYKVTNTGAYTTQVSVYSDETTITEDGWEEVAETFEVKLIDAGQSDTITVPEGAHVDIQEPAVIELELQ